MEDDGDGISSVMLITAFSVSPRAMVIQVKKDELK